MIKSPCTSICKIDPENNVCLGCGRSLKEISDWTNMDDKEKEKLLLNLKNRVNEE
jgi:predicted Fe-S protein YdhL (DUF1289 family)|tara:strand:+ start:283 stop:447 length:165 start_codon:yes stop_codon:yes gene_type:complete